MGGENEGKPHRSAKAAGRTMVRTWRKRRRARGGRAAEEPLSDGGLSSVVPGREQSKAAVTAPGPCRPRTNPPPARLQVNFNEPLSMLQRLTEDLEYHRLLDAAARCSSAVEQMCLVAAFSVSSYSTTVPRIAQPFNPMLGETFELDRLDDMGLRSLCEQVRPTPAPARPGHRRDTD